MINHQLEKKAERFGGKNRSDSFQCIYVRGAIAA